jgi:hypothetical protein
MDFTYIMESVLKIAPVECMEIVMTEFASLVMKPAGNVLKVPQMTVSYAVINPSEMTRLVSSQKIAELEHTLIKTNKNVWHAEFHSVKNVMIKPAARHV